ncbi:SH2 domain-containing adapter protein F-like [Gadus macrocephalus]|uniref:SH2 domain-containing adapter protein F-like n=1 Tax=Gadus macrocephalus TaxID=80720 RepID=UPI0028CB3434|nr:SH2 domain-containing adapter protein F-like [Gadus macrocephalus]
MLFYSCNCLHLFSSCVPFFLPLSLSLSLAHSPIVPPLPQPSPLSWWLCPGVSLISPPPPPPPVSSRVVYSFHLLTTVSLPSVSPPSPSPSPSPSTPSLVIRATLAVEIKVIKDLPWPPPVGQLNSTSPLLEEEEPPSPSQPPPGQSGCDQHHNVQFEGVDKPRGSPPCEAKTRPPQRHSSGCLVNTKMTPLDHCSPSQGERIDPGLPLENQFWYHGAVSRTDAESLLRLCKEASYLVRNSETSKNDFSLSLKSSQGFMHMKLARTKEGKYVLGQNSCPFDSVPEIIHFYSSRKLPIKGAEHMSLLYPVAIRTL